MAVGKTETEFDNKWRCCCLSMSYKTGAFLIAILEIVYATINLIGGIVSTATLPTNNPAGAVLGIFIGLLIIITAALMIVGLERDSPYFIIPHLIGQIIAMLLFLALLITGIVFAAKGGIQDKVRMEDTGAALIVYSVVCLCFFLWFFCCLSEILPLCSGNQQGRGWGYAYE